jgi:hypothetical protein
LKINHKVTEPTTSHNSYDSYDSSSSYVSYDDPSSSIPYTENDSDYNSDSDASIDESELNIETETVTETETETEANTTESQNNKTIILGEKKKTNNRGRFKSVTTLPTYENYKANEAQQNQKNKLSKNEILDKLRDCTSLNTIEEMEILKTLPIMKTWIRYINRNTKMFRAGGMLLKIQYPDYMVLANPFTKVMWSVKLSENILFIKDKEEARKTNKIKDKLYKLYLEGRLILKDV